MPARKRKGECPHCQGIGFLIEENQAVPCECQQELRRELRLRQAKIPRKFSAKSLANFETDEKGLKPLVQSVRQYIENFNPHDVQAERKGLLLIGCVGSGKTHVAISILHEIVKKGYRGLYWNVPILLEELRSSYDDDAPERGWEILERSKEVELLVLDDLGSQRTTSWVLDRLYLIINHRYEQLLPLVVTSNLPPDELREHVGERIVSRLCEMCHLIKFPRRDYRQHMMKWDEDYRRRKKGSKN